MRQQQNKFEVHVLHRLLALADDVRKDTSSCVGRGDRIRRRNTRVAEDRWDDFAG